MDCEEIFTPSQLVKLLKTAEIYLVPRDKNKQFKWKSGATTEDVENCIRSLEERHMIDGPVDDEDKTKKGKIYVFHTMFLERHWIYIKLKVKLNKLNNKFIAVISFHD